MYYRLNKKSPHSADAQWLSVSSLHGYFSITENWGKTVSQCQFPHSLMECTWTQKLTGISMQPCLNPIWVTEPDQCSTRVSDEHGNPWWECLLERDGVLPIFCTYVHTFTHLFIYSASMFGKYIRSFKENYFQATSTERDSSDSYWTAASGMFSDYGSSTI